MTRWLFALPAFAALNGCIIYDSTGGKCHGCDDENDEPGGGVDDTSGAVDTATDDTGGEDTDVIESAWSVNPNIGSPGDLLIVTFAKDDGSDTLAVSSITPYGAAVLGQLTNTGTSIMAPLQVDAAATAGTVDFLITLDDGNAEWLDSAFTIVVNGGTDTGNGAVDTGSEDTGSEDTGSGGNDTGGCE